MKSLQKKHLRGAVALAAVAGAVSLAGCAASSESGPAVNFGSPMGLLRVAAAAFVQGRSVDANLDAMRRGDKKGMTEAMAWFKRASRTSASPTLAAEEAIQEAVEMERRFSGGTPEQRRAAESQLDAMYRSALEIQPDLAQTSKNRDSLNSLGYHLADRGKTMADFKKAEELTHSAVVLWDRELQGLSGRERDNPLAVRAAGPLDSYAWALYKQGRYKEAQAKQEEVLRAVATQNPEGYGRAEVLYHMGEIYLAVKMYRKASSQFQAALAAAPEPRIKAMTEAAQKRIPDGYGAPDPVPPVKA